MSAQIAGPVIGAVATIGAALLARPGKAGVWIVAIVVAIVVIGILIHHA